MHTCNTPCDPKVSILLHGNDDANHTIETLDGGIGVEACTFRVVSTINIVISSSHHAYHKIATCIHDMDKHMIVSDLLA